MTSAAAAMSVDEAVERVREALAAMPAMPVYVVLLVEPGTGRVLAQGCAHSPEQAIGMVRSGAECLAEARMVFDVRVHGRKLDGSEDALIASHADLSPDRVLH